MTDDATPTNRANDSKPPATDRTKLWIALGVVAAVLVILGIWWASSTVTVPTVVGLSQAEASAQLDAAALKVGRVSEESTIAVEPGTVVQQSPAPDSKASKNSAVDLTVAVAPTVSVPNVVGTTESEADAALASEGLRMGAVNGVFSDTAKVGIIVSQSPAASTEVTVATLVNLEISLGKKQGTVPDVVGLTSSDAKNVLTTAGFTTSEAKTTSTEVEAGVVISQSPAAGTSADPKATVKLTVSTGAPASSEPAPAEPATTTPPAPTTPAEPTAPAPTPKPEPKPPAPAEATVPDVIGSRVLEALRALRKAKLGFDIAWGPTADGFLTVIAQDPKGGTSVDPGTVVTVTIGLPEFLFSAPEVQPLPAPTTKPSTPSTPSAGSGSTDASATTP